MKFFNGDTFGLITRMFGKGDKQPSTVPTWQPTQGSRRTDKALDNVIKTILLESKNENLNSKILFCLANATAALKDEREADRFTRANLIPVSIIINGNVTDSNIICDSVVHQYGNGI
ncbi:MAG: hypothetical protein MJZ69_10820 [Bacteroidaceae bacterium]|nr:hypothetical protein [Bacteroidaceae bacterium]